METRAMVPADVPEVWELEKELFPTDAWPLEMFYDELAQHDTRTYWVVSDGTRIIAYAGMMCVLPLADVQTIAVRPEAEGRGIGSHLLRLMITGASNANATDLLLEVREDNPRAQGLYARHGFEAIHRRKGYYREGVDAIIMRKVLITAT
ncbi:ribosomal protein S18-alanine N-acetyltransferase [Paeniglutamicibacter sp. Y32M11]|uniref:ribosomal protein S18-alanine N-acetyltransferase n=1 Tax=Paeniglutamicibacter sp. Y32M11 TaxID=2853258 RepID=UPI001C530A09|nr:ribosomal protein S18-alanine N-acetyltransferase [Paeniglutamicibacter sp. Y32M11]QXQ12197.1 ribosomal protein S18-alanine N-acetyltransferase [Paeniglutamicibacter sp. Y32M11]